MSHLCDHIFKTVCNSFKAGAKNISIFINERPRIDEFEIIITDDGSGMPPELAKNAANPFVTSDASKRVGLGLALFKFAAEQTGGSLSIKSIPGYGTVVRAVFSRSSIDRLSLGDIAETICGIAAADRGANIIYEHTVASRGFYLNTRNLPDIMAESAWIKGYISKKEQELSGGATLI